MILLVILLAVAPALIAASILFGWASCWGDRRGGMWGMRRLSQEHYEDIYVRRRKQESPSRWRWLAYLMALMGMSG